MDRLRLDVRARADEVSATVDAEILGGGASGTASLASGRLEADLQVRGVRVEALARALS